jgi:hypothetical protein
MVVDLDSVAFDEFIHLADGPASRVIAGGVVR